MCVRAAARSLRRRLSQRRGMAEAWLPAALGVIVTLASVVATVRVLRHPGRRDAGGVGDGEHLGGEGKAKPQRKPAVRFAEKNRDSTCPFADRVANAVIAAFREKCPAELAASYRQTVLAGFVLENMATDSLCVVAFGVGTKFLSQELIKADVEGMRVRDSHAEILARRALQRFLYTQARLALKGNDRMDETCIFEMAGVGGKPLRLKQGMRFHFYSSSVPCGNASIKRWAHPKRPKRRDLPSNQYPTEPHPPFHVMQPEQGQVAPLVKMERPPSVDVPSFLPIVVAPGTAPMGRGFGTTLTCSDKIAMYNALGIQGCLLSCFFLPIYVKTVTVGRKFSEKTCQRALCCRLGDFSYGSYQLHHPSMLQTAVKFDRGVIKVDKSGQAACFHESRCMSWWRPVYDFKEEYRGGTYDSERFIHDSMTILDGTTGLCPDNAGGSISKISRIALLNEFQETLHAWRPQESAKFATRSISETKRLVGEKGYTCYTAAKKRLLWKWLPEWAEAKGVQRPET